MKIIATQFNEDGTNDAFTLEGRIASMTERSLVRGLEAGGFALHRLTESATDVVVNTIDGKVSQMWEVTGLNNDLWSLAQD